MKRNYTLIPLCLVLLAFIACSNNTKKTSDDTETTTKSVVNVPQFNADSAYQYVKAQVDHAFLIRKHMWIVAIIWLIN